MVKKKIIFLITGVVVLLDQLTKLIVKSSLKLGDSVGVNKPNRKFYNVILKKFKLKAKECVMVGDKPEVDLRLAKRLGMKTVWVKYGAWSEGLRDKRFSYVDHVVKDFRKLREIL